MSICLFVYMSIYPYTCISVYPYISLRGGGFYRGVGRSFYLCRWDQMGDFSPDGVLRRPERFSLEVAGMRKARVEEMKYLVDDLELWQIVDRGGDEWHCADFGAVG